MNKEISLQLSSFNVNGLRQDIKINAIFTKLKPSNNIILLQETHSSTEIENKWKNKWGGQIIVSDRTSNSKGDAILILQNIEYSMCDKITDIEGRILIVKLKINEICFIICNVYAPIRDHKKEQISFINLLKDKLSNLEQDNILIEGDLKLYLYPKLDKQDYIKQK